jgi:2-polyprenyl-3-methyl-5-hydroxy-6-metoxy-1,4-benzoquinol methylase
MDRPQKVQKFILTDPPGRLLDVGCNIGSISEPFVKAGFDVYGIDVSAKYIETCRSKNIKAVCGDITQGLPFEDSFFNYVIAGEIIEHLIDTDFFLAEIHRVLSKNGCLVITTPNILSLENRLRILVGRYPLFVDYKITDDNHLRVYCARALKKQLIETNFKIEKIVGSFVPLFYSVLKKTPVSLIPLLGFLGEVLPDLSMHIIIKARKIGE